MPAANESIRAVHIACGDCGRRGPHVLVTPTWVECVCGAGWQALVEVPVTWLRALPDDRCSIDTDNGTCDPHDSWLVDGECPVALLRRTASNDGADDASK